MHRRLIGLLAVAAILVLGASACSSDDGGSDGTTTTKPAPPVTMDDLNGTAFVGDDVTGHDLVAKSSLRFVFEDGSLAVNGGCNTITTEAAVDDGVLKWTGAPAETMMACEEPLAQQDDWLTELLTGGVKAELADGTLTLTSDDVTIVLTEEDPAKAEDLPLVGTAWTLEATIDGTTEAPVPDGVEAPTLTIASDGNAAIFAGCNNGAAQVTIAKDGSTATFGPVSITKKLCPEGGSDVEAMVLAVLDGEVEVQIQGNELTLTKGDQSLRYHGL